MHAPADDRPGRLVVALVLVGAPGTGKSSVLEELATLHDIEDIAHGDLEAEQLSLGRPLLPASSWVRQLAAILALQREGGRTRFLISATVETQQDLAAVVEATGAALRLVVCLSASAETVAARLDAREPDRWPGKLPLIARARRLASSTPGLSGVDVVIDTEHRTARDVAAEVLGLMRRRAMLE
jgi:gluconate kinase